MRKLISCKYHEDSQTVELLYTNGTLIDIDCMTVEDEVAQNMYERSELNYLLTHDPVGYRGACSMDFYRIECFLTAAETGSMTKAAERMCITQPAISFQIRELEKELQVPLFERDHAGIHLTDSGKIMQAGFTHIMDSYRRLLNKVLENSYGKLRLTVGYHSFIDRAGLHSFIAGFSARHPEIEVSILEQQCKELADYLELGTLDVAIVLTSELKGRNTLSAMPLFQEKTCFAVPRTHRLADKEKITIEDLRGETILMNNHPSVCMNELIDNLICSGIRSDHLRFYDQPNVCLAMSVARQGLPPCRSLSSSAISRSTMWNMIRPSAGSPILPPGAAARKTLLSSFFAGKQAA